MILVKQTIRILLTGAGSPGASGVIKSLRSTDEYQFWIVGTDCNPHSTGFHLVDQSYVCPRAADASFIPAILEICRNEKIDVLFSLVTSELEKLAKSVDAFRKQGTALLISQPETIR